MALRCLVYKLSGPCRDVPGPILGQLVDYCYTSAVEVTEENVQALLAAAGRLQLSWVQEVTCEFLQHRLEPSNCLAIASLADTHSCQSLLAAAEAVALHSFSEVACILKMNGLRSFSRVYMMCCTCRW